MGFGGPIEDRIRIRERYDIYSDAVFRADLEAYLACWTRDGIRSGAGGECEGLPALRDHWTETRSAIAAMTFFTQIAAIDIDGDRASARAFSLEILRMNSGETHQVVGMYEDELERQADDWLFARRHYAIVMTA